MRKKRLRVATLDEVQISRDGDDAIIEFVDSTVATMHLRLGPDVQQMTEEEIFENFNFVILAQQLMAAEYEHVAAEVPLGTPQVKYFEPGNQWVPRGTVLRCLIDDDDNEAVVTIDGQKLSMRELGRLLAAYAGWGMRIAFVPDDKIEMLPRIEVREPD